MDSAQTPFFSIIVPVYNRMEPLRICLESLLKQNFTSYEIVVVDDGSTMDIESIINDLDNDIIRYYKKENGERGAARNYGAEKARGMYLNFFDSDDYALPNHLSVAYTVASHDEPKVFNLAYAWTDENLHAGKVVDDLKSPLLRVLREQNILSCNSVFVHKSAFQLQKFNEDRALAGSEDWEYWLRLAARHEWKVCNEVTSYVIDHEERSVRTMDIDKIIERKIKMIEYAFADPEVNKTLKGYKRKMKANAWLYVALHAALKKDKSRAKKYLLKATKASLHVIGRRMYYGTIKHLLFA